MADSSKTGPIYFSSGPMIFAGGLTPDRSFNLNTSGTSLDRTFTVSDGPAPIDLLVTTILTNTTGSNVTGLVKAGAGTMRIGTAATYNGSTTISNGVLSLNIANATPVTAKGSNSAGISTTAGDNVVNVNGGTLNIDVTGGLGSGANLNVAGGTVTAVSPGF